ncbi:MAG: hypothetical protein DMD95_11515 [Candidatus Rokuibacteriota bacterium]|nr:MAG: hypothetical protein DMD95_11515 [Candidatus Rokubacteria bacterium]
MVVAASLDFRMPPVASYPGSMADITYGIRWAKTRAARWHSRPDRVGTMGSSSGGHQAMLSVMRPKDARYSARALRRHVLARHRSAGSLSACQAAEGSRRRRASRPAARPLRHAVPAGGRPGRGGAARGRVGRIHDQESEFTDGQARDRKDHRVRSQAVLTTREHRG